MTQSLLDLLAPPAASADRIYGVVIGIVTNNRDPNDLGRVKLRFPWLSDDMESSWARVASPMAGKGRGVYLLPEVDDEVLVAFEHGDIGYPYVLGALWNGQDTPPETNSDGKNNIRSITSRSGHVIRLDDTDGSEKIEIVDKTKKNKIVFDSAANTITISADADITIESSTGKLKLSGNSVEITSGTGIKMEAAANADVSAGGQLNLKGALVNIN